MKLAASRMCLKIIYSHLLSLLVLRPPETIFFNDKTFSSEWFGMTIGDAIEENDPSCDKKPIYGTGKPIQTR